MEKPDVLFTTRVLANPFNTNTNVPSFLSEVEYSFNLSESGEIHKIRALVPGEFITKTSQVIKFNKAPPFSFSTPIEKAVSIKRARDIWGIISKEMDEYIV